MNTALLPCFRCRLIHVAQRIDLQQVAFQLQSRQVHPGGAVPRRGREDRYAATVSRRQQAAFLLVLAGLLLACGQVLTDEVVKLRRAEGALKRLAAAEGAVKVVGGKEVIVLKNDVVNPDDVLLAQLQVVKEGPRLMQVHAQGEVGVVVEVRSGADDPVEETGLHQRHQARHAQTCRGQRSGQRQADGHVGGQHFVGKETTGLAQPAGVVRQERFLDHGRQTGAARQGWRIDALVADAVQILLLLWR
jgi:hypothetical protein